MQNKSKKLTSRLLSALLALACVLTLLPGVAVAAETMTMLKKEEGSMVLEKGAVLEDDGTYTIQLSAYATGTTTMVPQESSVPLDIVLVLDQSGSMAGSNLTALRTAVTNFVQTIKENAEKYQVDHRIAVVGFAGAEYNSSNYYTMLIQSCLLERSNTIISKAARSLLKLQLPAPSMQMLSRL